MKIDVSKGFEIGAITYGVDMSDKAREDLIGKDCYGDHQGYNKVVRIANNIGNDQIRNTFIHECIEAVSAHYCNNKIKHDEITNLANGLSQIFKSLNIEFVCNGGSDGNHRRDDKKKA